MPHSVRLKRKCVLGGAVDLVPRRHIFRGDPHVAIAERVGQLSGHHVCRGDVADLLAGTRCGHLHTSERTMIDLRTMCGEYDGHSLQESEPATGGRMSAEQVIGCSGIRKHLSAFSQFTAALRRAR